MKIPWPVATSARKELYGGRFKNGLLQNLWGRARSDSGTGKDLTEPGDLILTTNETQ